MNNVGSLELRPKGKVTSGDPLQLHLSFVKMYFRIGFYRVFLDSLRDPLSHFKAFLDLFYRDFVPHVGSHPIAYFLGFATFSEPGGTWLLRPGEPADRRWGNRPGRIALPALKETE